MPINQKEIKQKDEILQHLRNDINYYSSGELRAFVASDVITQEDLHVVFSHNQIEAVCDDYNHKIDRISVNLINIPTGDLEIYFWGDIDSGKTCAIDALLTVLHTKGIILQNKDDYFNILHLLHEG